MDIVTYGEKGEILEREEVDNNFLQLKAGIEAAKADIEALQAKSGDNSLLAQFVGAVKAQVGVQRYYPRSALVISSVFAYLSEVATETVVAKVRVDGVVVSTITIAAGHDQVTQAVNLIVPQGSFVTVDIVSGVGNNLSLRFDY